MSIELKSIQDLNFFSRHLLLRQERNSVCAICYDSFKNKDPVYHMAGKVHHIFCRSCIEGWFTQKGDPKKGECPICFQTLHLNPKRRPVPRNPICKNPFENSCWKEMDPNEQLALVVMSVALLSIVFLGAKEIVERNDSECAKLGREIYQTPHQIQRLQQKLQKSEKNLRESTNRLREAALNSKRFCKSFSLVTTDQKSEPAFQCMVARYIRSDLTEKHTGIEKKVKRITKKLAIQTRNLETAKAQAFSLRCPKHQRK